MKTLDRYIFNESLLSAVIALVALTSVAFLAFSREIGWLLELIVRQSATTSEIWAISAAILPNVLTFTIPMAVLVGILTGFGRMSSDSEAIAFRANGISMVRLLVPVMLLGVIAWGSNLAMTMWIAPRTAAQLRDLEYEMIAKQVSPKAPGKYSYEKFENTQISMAMPEAPAKKDKTTISEMSTSALWNRMQTGTATYEERVQFHRRLALPFACLVFTLAGLPLGVS